jgi:ferric-dicitrate binding protein FerR (iron transport regulator)
MMGMDNRLLELASRYLDRLTDERETRELEEMLTANAEARLLMGRLLNQHVALRSMFTGAASVSQFEATPVDRTKTTPDFEVNRPGTMFRRLVPLAIAASLLIAAGLLFHFRKGAPTSPGFRIGTQVGTVALAGNRVSTGSNSFCTVIYPDNTLVALNESTAVSLEKEDRNMGKQVHLETGALYLDVPTVGKRLGVTAGQAAYEVTGTKFIAQHVLAPDKTHYGEGLIVVEGCVRFAKNGLAHIWGRARD